ncbi:hypothetical protein [Dethiosulfatarculus sandiegensis]|uniref:Uncharacterized protein n=1 Tax=Dethiosulfatarculus sandiegensis TaxID=1429043 RepID=A0A0D2J794_9BACT|nr:hypothetical protein [Dethiosulfatarculus sandiegensis]KIX14064.1 hypothetical protein X474_10545 [Dethiosulfatarculus sandiegensis]
MVEFPPYVRLVVNNAAKRVDGHDKDAPQRTKKQVKPSAPTEQASATGRETTAPGAAPVSSKSFKQPTDMVDLISNENRPALDSLPPTTEEAEEALARLKADLPAMGQAVGDLHSKLDRRVILTLLAPLVL